jgi:hypothetical protein
MPRRKKTEEQLARYRKRTADLEPTYLAQLIGKPVAQCTEKDFASVRSRVLAARKKRAAEVGRTLEQIKAAEKAWNRRWEKKNKKRLQEKQRAWIAAHPEYYKERYEKQKQRVLIDPDFAERKRKQINDACTRYRAKRKFLDMPANNGTIAHTLRLPLAACPPALIALRRVHLAIAREIKEMKHEPRR